MAAVYGPVEHAVRTEIYRLFVETGQAPTAEQVAEGVELAVEETRQAFEALHELRAIFLRSRARHIGRAMPFSASPTSYRVRVGSREHWACCAWDALGIPAAMDADGEIYGDGLAGGDAVRLEIRDGRLLGDPFFMSFVVPARNWWDDIDFFCSTVQFFHSEAQVERWERESQLTVGALLPGNRAWELARIWYHDRLDPDWRPKLRPELQGRLTWVGLMSEFWQL